MKHHIQDTPYVVCIKNEGYAASLEVRKIYQLLIDDQAANHQFIRIIDESGEDYLYPADYFIPIELPQAVTEAFAAAAWHGIIGLAGCPRAIVPNDTSWGASTPSPTINHWARFSRPCGTRPACPDGTIDHHPTFQHGALGGTDCVLEGRLRIAPCFNMGHGIGGLPPCHRPQ